jgi:hypothetical protein
MNAQAALLSVHTDGVLVVGPASYTLCLLLAIVVTSLLDAATIHHTDSDCAVTSCYCSPGAEMRIGSALAATMQQNSAMCPSHDSSTLAAACGCH